jgi:5-formyltetrahydrofolate cyclo-ligase
MRENRDHTKDLVRRAMRAAREALSAAEVDRWSAAACRCVVGLPVFMQAGCLVAYVARDNELDPGMAVDAARAAGKDVYYPSRGDFRLEAPETASNGVAQGETLAPGREDVLFLVPGLAFDQRGARLGRGGGWYDRALAAHPTGTRIGLAYELQVFPTLPEAAWDIRMDAVVTEARVLAAGAAGATAVKENHR